MFRTLAVLVAVAVLAGAASALAQTPSTISVTPTTVKHLRRVTLSGTGWGANLGTTVCRRMRVTSKTATGPTRLFSAPIVGPPNTAFRTSVLVRLPPGAYTLTASQSCTSPNGGGAATAITKLTVIP